MSRETDVSRAIELSPGRVGGVREWALGNAVGVPAYHNTAGGRPGAPTELTRYGQLMDRLSLRLHRGRF